MTTKVKTVSLHTLLTALAVQKARKPSAINLLTTKPVQQRSTTSKTSAHLPNWSSAISSFASTSACAETTQIVMQNNIDNRIIKEHARKEGTELKTGDVDISAIVANTPDIPSRTRNNSAAYDSVASDWPQPEQLPADLPSVRPFLFDCLPKTLSPWIQDIAERMQCAPDFPAATALVTLGSAIGSKLGICPRCHDDWLIIPNLWGCIIGPPGVLKTPAMEQALSPLRSQQQIEHERYNAELKQYEDTAWQRIQLQRLAKQKIDKLLKDGRYEAAQKEAVALASATSTPPVLRRYEINDTTIAKIVEILKQNPAGLTIYRDELAGFFRNFDKKGNQFERPFYLEAWNGAGKYAQDRIGRGTIILDRVTLSVVGAIQPQVLTDYLRDSVSGSSGDGLLQRFQLAVWPDVRTEWTNVDRNPDVQARSEAIAVFRHLDKLDLRAVGADINDGIPFLRFAPKAQERFDIWRENLEKNLRVGAEHPAFEGHLAKYRKLLPALALIIHLSDRGAGPVTLSAIEKGLIWTEYLESHARRIYAAALHPDTSPARQLANRMRTRSLSPKFTLRDIYRRGWTSLTTKSEV